MSDFSELRHIEIRENEPMRAHTSFRIGGPVRAMIFPKSEQELREVLTALSAQGTAPMIIGNGTNLLFTDAPTDLVVVKTAPNVGEVRITERRTLIASCGTSLARLATFAADNALAGLEFAHGIPGSVGGGIVMNAGAYGGEMRNVVQSVSALAPDGSVASFTGHGCDFAYRHSVFSTNEHVILAAEFAFSDGDADEIRNTMQALARRRRESQPLDLPSAGSAFKRPKPITSGEPIYAAKLIDDAGLRGYSIGGAAVSEKHAGFIVNRGDATFSDVVNLLSHIKFTVQNRFRVTLEPEIKIIGGDS